MRSGQDGEKSRIAVDAVRRTKRTVGDEGCRGRTRKEGNRTGMHGRMRRVTGYPTATLILRENERVLIRISSLYRLDRL